MTEGEKVGNIFAAASRFFFVLRTRKASGIIIQAYCFDRAMFPPVAKMLFQRQKLWYSRQAEAQGVAALGTE
eukprot:1985899-Lingulodinium_polyedra.AAC.1